jgi:hypothetical protein
VQSVDPPHPSLLEEGSKLLAAEVASESAAYELPSAMRERRTRTGQPFMHSFSLLYADAHAVDLGDLLGVLSQKPVKILVLAARADDEILLTLAEEFLERLEMRDRTDQVYVTLAGEWRGEYRINGTRRSG